MFVWAVLMHSLHTDDAALLSENFSDLQKM